MAPHWLTHPLTSLSNWWHYRNNPPAPAPPPPASRPRGRPRKRGKGSRKRATNISEDWVWVEGPFPGDARMTGDGSRDNVRTPDARDAPAAESATVADTGRAGTSVPSDPRSNVASAERSTIRLPSPNPTAEREMTLSQALGLDAEDRRPVRRVRRKTSQGWFNA